MNWSKKKKKNSSKFYFQHGTLPVSMQLEIAPQHHLFIIGRGGMNIKQIMQRTGASIHFPDPSTVTPQRKGTVYLTGSIESVFLARHQLIVSTNHLSQWEYPKCFSCLTSVHCESELLITWGVSPWIHYLCDDWFYIGIPFITWNSKSSSTPIVAPLGNTKLIFCFTGRYLKKNPGIQLNSFFNGVFGKNIYNNPYFKMFSFNFFLQMKIDWPGVKRGLKIDLHWPEKQSTLYGLMRNWEIIGHPFL